MKRDYGSLSMISVLFTGFSRVEMRNKASFQHISTYPHPSFLTQEIAFPS